MDANGDSEGNFSVLALKEAFFSTKDNFTCDRQMVQVATFYQGNNDNYAFPVSEFAHISLFSCYHLLYAITQCKVTDCRSF
jgi:hypothetical protein